MNRNSQFHLLDNFLLEAKINSQNLLKEFTLDKNLFENIEIAFGKNYNKHTLESFYQNWLEGYFGDFPKIEVRASADINNANGAFSNKTNKIYLSQEFLANNNTLAVSNLLLEEYGHYLDSKLNLVDSTGDEGAIFSALVSGKKLTASELQQLRNEDDGAVVTIDGEEVAIEQNLPDTVLYSNRLNSKDYSFSFQTADYLKEWTGLNIKNQDRYKSGNDFVAKLPWGGNKYNLLGGSLGFLGASAGFNLAPGFIEAGFEVEAGYNLGKFDVSLPFSAGVEAAIIDNQLTVDVDANFAAPKFNYTLPYVYAYLDAVLGYDIDVDVFGEAFAEIGFSVFGKKFSKKYSTGGSFDLISAKGESKKRLVQLDTRKNDNFIDLIYKKIQLGNKKDDSVSRSETSGFLELDFELPKFNGSFKPLAGNEFDPISGLDETDSGSGLKNEYLWEFKEEKKLVDADFAIDNLLAQIPFLAWLSKAGQKKFSVAGYDVGLEYDWRAIALDLSTSLSYGYNFKTGFTDLAPKINEEKSEIKELIDSSKSAVDKLTLDSFTDTDALTTALEAADKDGDISIDIVVEFNPKIIFDAEVYLKPKVDLEWDIGVVKGKLSPLVNNNQEFTLIPGKEENIYSNKIPIVAPTKQEVTFKELYDWLRETTPSLPDIDTEYNIEIPFSAIDPEKYPGTKGDDYIKGKDGDEGEKNLGDGNDIWVFSTGNDGEINGGNGFDTLKIINPESYSLTANTLADSNDNTTTFTSFTSVEIDGTRSITSGINISGDLSDENIPYIFGATSDFADKIENLNIHRLDTKEGDDIVKGNLYDIFGKSAELDTGIGDDEINVSSTTLPEEKTIIRAGAGDDRVNLTIIPYYVGSSYNSLFEIDLDTGEDSLKVTEANPIGGDSGILPPGELLVTGYLGGKTIDIDLKSANFSSEAILTADASVIKDLFDLEASKEIERLYVKLADSEISYKLNNIDANATEIKDTISRGDKITLDLTNSQLASEITLNPQDFNASNLTVDGDGDLTEIAIDTENIVEIDAIPDVEINNIDLVKVNSVNANFLNNKLLGDFRTLDLSEIVDGVSLSEDFLADDESLDIFELIFTDDKDTIYFSPDADRVTSEGENFNGELAAAEQLMSFDLGEGDDIFHDRTGLKNSSIFPGAGSDFIYGEGGFDEVFYDRGSRFDYDITVIDDRTVEVLYKPDNTIDTLVDVERINFDGADELVKNPYYQGLDIENAGYTTFTLQVSKADGWKQPPFVFAPFTYFLPFGTTEVTLTENLLLTNVYDPERNEEELEISYIDVYTNGDAEPELDTINPDADIWQLSIPGGLNDPTEPITVDSMVDTPSGSSQGNYLEIYPSRELSYPFATAAINLTAFDESELIEATEFNDTITSGAGDDTVLGNMGDDLLNGEAGNDSLDGGDGNDAIAGGAGNDNILGRLGNDSLTGDAGADILEGDGGTDTLDGGADSDLLLGGDGDDLYISNINESAGDIIQDTAGNDAIELVTTSDTEVIIFLDEPTSGKIGISKQDNSLIIDIDADGILDPELDLTIVDFFNRSAGENGFIENVANLSGEEIVDFLGEDSNTNLVWRNNKTGQNVVWEMDGAERSDRLELLAIANLDWEIQATDDFDNDGNKDLVWRNKTTGKNSIWLMEGDTRRERVELNPVSNTSWKIIDTADFDRDGETDLIWHNKDTGDHSIWLMSGTEKTSSLKLPSVPSSDWKIKSTDDFNNDDKIDLLWRNSKTGENVVWLMDDTERIGREELNLVSSSVWDIKGTGDFNGDGKADIVWRNDTAGANSLWLMDGTDFVSRESLLSASNDWSLTL